MNLFRRMLYETALNAGLKVISDDTCCRLMAWLYVFGGANEQTVFDERINAALMYAQKRLSLIGGEIPNTELLPVLQGYIKSAEECVKNGVLKQFTERYEKLPEWLLELKAEYNLETPKEAEI